MVEHWVELTAGDGWLRFEVERVIFYAGAWWLGFPRMGVVTGVGPTGVPGLTRLGLRFFLFGVSPSVGWGANRRGHAVRGPGGSLRDSVA